MTEEELKRSNDMVMKLLYEVRDKIDNVAEKLDSFPCKKGEECP